MSSQALNNRLDPPTTKPPKSLLDRVRKIGRLLKKPHYRRTLLFGLCGAAAAILIYSFFTALTGWESGLLGLPIGYLLGKSVQYGARSQRSKDAAKLTIFLMILAFLLGDIPRILWQGADGWGVLSSILSKFTLIFMNQEFHSFWKFAETILALLSLVAGGTWAKMMNE